MGFRNSVWAMVAAGGALAIAAPLAAQPAEAEMAQMAADIEDVMAIGADQMAMGVSQCAAHRLRGLTITAAERGKADAGYAQLQNALDQCGVAITASAIMDRLRTVSPDASLEELERKMTLALAPATIALLMLTHQLFGIPFDQPAPMQGDLPVRIPLPAS
ncbi:hypothetical protein GRI97_07070 [Altererythrobacter xixiisoli]|uniref:Uncharacterized protein n=1 Tax=Croceibacterium xixiisoli TaxID=1476466 RepID=A0A6I4TWM8_9SPHN|nr:hypothetical protein [Croceibacterium xixiisoli]MXO98743.1 hypothetical protein [Croceibacterium xixiisoli]